ncbi:MAG: hypothetical protein HZY79_01845 [Rhodoblastus sp.]|nr:MAG: hypothetical protein HZY79_01845 [Rhodoblastus sp.]
MAVSRKRQERALDEGEWRLVQRAAHPAVREASDRDLLDLARLLRERRDRARDQKRRRQREHLGKADPRGAAPSTRHDGTSVKHGLLAAAAARQRGDRTAPAHARAHRKRGAHVAAARRALALKLAADSRDDESFNSRHAREGMRAIPNRRAEALINPMERGRLRKQQAVAQAIRDAR